VLFLALSFLYEKFYTELGLHPEDVGLTRTAILARAAAGVVAIVGIGLIVAGAAFIISIVRWVLLWLGQKAIGLWRKLAGEQGPMIEKGLNKFKDFRIVRFIIDNYPVPGLSDPAAHYPFRLRQNLYLTGLIVLGALVVAFGFAIPAVNNSASAAAKGQDVVPLTTPILKIPVISVESQPCHAIWLGSAPEPSQLQDKDLHCLGSANGITLFRTSSQTVRVPSSQVATIDE
jgi:hypothetical protein